MIVRLTILGEPASKANSRKLATVGKKGARRTMFIKSEKAREYEAAALHQIPPDARAMLAGPVRVTIRIFYATERPDLDESVILDVLQAKYTPAKDGPRELIRAGVYVNDRQVREKHVYHGIDRANPRAEIEVEPLEAALFESLHPPPVKPRAPRRASARHEPALASDGNPF